MVDVDSYFRIVWFTSADADNNKSDFEASKGIRFKVFCDEQKFSMDIEIDEYDNKDHTAYHLLISDKSTNEPLATSRLIHWENEGEKKWKIGRVAVLKEHRGKKLGKRLMDDVFKKCEELKIPEIYCSSQDHVVEFYKKLGFVDALPEPYYEEHCLHYMLKKSFK